MFESAVDILIFKSTRLKLESNNKGSLDVSYDADPDPHLKKKTRINKVLERHVDCGYYPDPCQNHTYSLDRYHFDTDQVPGGKIKKFQGIRIQYFASQDGSGKELNQLKQY